LFIKLGTRFDRGQLALPSLLAALALLAFAPSAQAAKEHLFDPVLSLEGDCHAEDGVADPSCTGEPLAYPVGHAPKPFNPPCGVAADPHGDIYVTERANETTKGRIDVFDPKGNFLVEVPDEKEPCRIAVDSKGNVYVADRKIFGEPETQQVLRYEPSSYPPGPGTGYSVGATIKFEPDHSFGEPCFKRLDGVAVDPSNDHLYIDHPCKIDEYGSAAEGNPLIKPDIGRNVAVELTAFDIYGRNHDVYATNGPESGSTPKVLVFDGTDGHVKCEIDGSETPSGSFDFGIGGAIGVDQSSGDLYVYDLKHEAVDRFEAEGEGCPKYAGRLPAPTPTAVFSGTIEDVALGIDSPCRTGIGLKESCEAGTYNSPNVGEVYTTAGTGASNAHLFAFAAKLEAAPEEFKLTVSVTGTGSGTITSSPGLISCNPFCSDEFEAGAKVTLTAAPDPGSTFAGWSGACSGTGPCEVTMSEAKSVSAEFTTEAPILHKLTVSVTGNGQVSASEGTISGCTSAGGPSCEGEYEAGTKVLLTETPGAHSLFAGWQTLQCDESTAAACEVEIGAADEAVAASFVNTFPLTVSAEGTGEGTLTSSPGSISCSPLCGEEFKEGTEVTLTATPAVGSTFTSWKHCDAVNGRLCTVRVDEAKAVTALFASTKDLKLEKTGAGMGKVASSPGGISCDANCSLTTAAFKAGTVKLTATPAKGSQFAGWSGCEAEPEGRCEVSMSAAHTVEAQFAPIPKFTLQIAKAGGGTGTVKGKPAISCGTNCSSATSSFYQGTEVEITATPSKGSSFEWSGGAGTCFNTTSPCKVTMGEAAQLQAFFG
jgi:hypothetical protein